MKKYNFLITPLNGRNAGTEAFKSLKLTNIYNKIVVTDITKFSYGNHVCENFYIQPCASSGDYINSILKIVKKEKIDVIIPGSDYEIRALAKERERFKKLRTYLLMNSQEVINTCMDKYKTAEFFEKNNIPCIKTEVFSLRNVNNYNLFNYLGKKLHRPFIIKPNFFSGGSNTISIIQDRYDLGRFIKLNSHYRDKFIAQEYIDAPNKEYTVGVMSDKSGRIISSFAMKRDLSTPDSVKLRVKNKHKSNVKSEYLIISSGLSQGLVRDYPKIREFSEDIALKLKSAGPLNIQCREYENKIYIFEINPRFSGTTSIRAIMGHNDVKLIFYSVVKDINLGQQKYKFSSVVRGRSVEYREIK